MTAATRTTTIGTAIGAAGTFGLGAVVARRLLFPTPYTATATVRPSAPASAGSANEVTFAATRDTRLPGTYRITRGSTSVRVGQVLGGGDGDGDTVRRQLVDGPHPAAGDWTWDALMHDVVAEVLPGPATGADAAVAGVSGIPRDMLEERTDASGNTRLELSIPAEDFIDRFGVPVRDNLTLLVMGQPQHGGSG